MNVSNVKYERDGKIAAIIDGTLYEGLHPGLGIYQKSIRLWLEAGNTPEPWETAAEKLNRLVREKRAEIISELEAVEAQLQEGYTEGEIKSWDKQIEEAKATKANSNSVTPLLDGIIKNRRISKADLADLVLQKANAYAEILGPAMGRKQQRIEDLFAIDLSAPDAEEQILNI